MRSFWLLFNSCAHVLVAASAPATTAPAAAGSAVARGALLEAIAAVHGPVAARLERHFGLAVATGADGREHLAWAG